MCTEKPWRCVAMVTQPLPDVEVGQVLVEEEGKMSADRK
jgi:hypothetical protein